MERKIITYKGINKLPSDISVIDGTLEESVNVICRNGEVTPIIPPYKIFALPDSIKLLKVHKTDNETNYICVDGDIIKFCKLDNSEIIFYPCEVNFATKGSLIKYETIGNTVILSFSTYGLYYCLYRNGDYVALGSKPPLLDISFSLSSKFVSTVSDTTYVDEFTMNDVKGHVTLPDGVQASVTRVGMGALNKFMQEEVRNENKFALPFLVRYAYRLYDGSTYMPSVPVLITPTIGLPAIVSADNARSGDKIKEINYKVHSFVCELEKEISNLNSIKEALNDWSDIIESIDFFVSSPIYNYKQSENIEGLHRIHAIIPPHQEVTYYSVSNLNNEQNASGDKLYRQHKITSYVPNNRTNYGLVIPLTTTKDFRKNISDCSVFYKISKLKISELTASRDILPIEDGIIKTLEVQETLVDEYNTHNTIIPQTSYVYNQRLNIANIKEILFNGYNSNSSFQFINAKSSTSGMSDTINLRYEIYTFIEQNGKKIVMNTSHSGSLMYISDYLFFQNTNVKKIIIKKTLISAFTFSAIAACPPGGCDDATDPTKDHNPNCGGGGENPDPGPNPDPDPDPNPDPTSYPQYLIINNIKEHNYLNGSYWFSDFGKLAWVNEYKIDTSILVPTTDNIIIKSNYLFQSEINNPFYFPLQLMNEVSNGDIVDIASTTKALSEGQFGQFPLYIFTSEGIWSMNTNSTGTYDFKQVVTRDVCNNPKSITQIDGAVIFVSAKGLMIIIGSEIMELSAQMKGNTYDWRTKLPLFPNVEHWSNSVDNNSFLDYLHNAQIAYDYKNNSLIITSSTKQYQYYYDIANKSFAKLYGDGVYDNVINFYPDCLLQKGNDIYSLLQTQDVNTYLPKIKGLLITRPIKFDNATTLKTIYRLNNKGDFHPLSKRALLLYGSRDCIKWFKLTSLRGTPFNYYRFCFQFNVKASDKLTFTACDTQERYINKMR